MDSLVPSTLSWWARVGNNGSIADRISEAINIGHKLAEKKPLGLNYIAANPFPHNCTLPENYMRLLAPHENKHSSKISTHCGN